MDLKKVLSWIPGWLGFLLLILVGLAMTINGAANPNLDSVNRFGFILFGLCAVAIGCLSWIAGGTSKIKGREGKVGVKVAVTDMPWWAWIADIGILVVSVVVFAVAS